MDHHHNNDKTSIKCTVCENEFELPHGTKDGDRVTCPNCFAQLMVVIDEGKKQLRCAICSNPLIKECPVDCEKKFVEREKRGFFDVKL